MSATLTDRRRMALAQNDAERASALARQLNRHVLLSRIESVPVSPDPLAFLAAGAAALGGGSLWFQPKSRTAFAGAGSATTICGSGVGRFSAVSATIRELGDALVREDGETTFPIIGGFAFREAADESSAWCEFPDGMLVVPRVVLQTQGASSLIRTTMRVEPTTTPSSIEREMRDLLDRARQWSRSAIGHESNTFGVVSESVPSQTAWESSVTTAISLIRQSMLDKVVLAREERLRASNPFSPIDTLDHLRAMNADATIFAIQSGTSWFLGATPERLVRLEDGHVDVSCLAGSVGAGRTPEERQDLAAKLLASAKDRQEHEIVVRATEIALSEVCEDVTRLAKTPRVVAASSVQHLETPIQARLASAGNVLDLVERLHPTPAVGGFPRDPAAAVIRELEEIDRGWYAGPFGWVDADGCGEFSVAIRSALLSGRTASVFAGCGIVAGSMPHEEFEEARLKMEPMLAALGAA